MSGLRNQQIRSEPFNRLTRIANDLGTAFDAHPDHIAGDQAIILIEDAGDVGTMLYGYTDPAEVITAILHVLQAVLKSVGKSMQLQFDGEEPIDL
jgi:hypothetical protein